MSEPQQIINVGAVANDGTGESLRDAFAAVNNNFANVWAAGPVDTQVVISNNRISTTQTNLDLVLAGNGVGTVTVASTTVPSVDAVYDLGRANRRFDEVHAVYYYGNGAYLTGINANGTGGGTVTFGPGAPVNANIGDIWIESSTGVQYLYFNDNTSNQWAEMEAYQSFSSASGNANIDLTQVGSDIIPAYTNSYSLGNSTNQWQDLWVSNATIYLNSIPLTADGGNLKFNGNTLLTTNASLTFANLSVSGNVVAGAVYSDNYRYANGAPFPQGGNAIPGTTISLKDNVISTTVLNQNLILSANGVGNVQTNSSLKPSIDGVYDVGSSDRRYDGVYARYFYGNGAGLTGIVSTPVNTGDWAFTGNTMYDINGGFINNSDRTHGATASFGLPANGNTSPVTVLNYYGNFSVTTANAPSFTKSWTFDYTGNITLPTTSSNINYSNGVSILNGIGGSYSNANVAAYLPTYTGNLNPGNLSSSGNVVGNNITATGNIYIGNTVFTRTLTVGRAVTPVTVPLASNNSFNVLTVGGGNVVVYTT